jgi:hypothetical protein
MKLTIDTKFDIGDIVYAADHYYDYCADHTPYIVSDIIINISNRGVHTMYCVEYEDRANRFPEDWLFATYEECTKWCDEQNK